MQHKGKRFFSPTSFRRRDAEPLLANGRFKHRIYPNLRGFGSVQIRENLRPNILLQSEVFDFSGGEDAALD
jgi:hypothetical protein